VLPACIVVAAGHVATGIALCIGLLPVALAGMRPARRGRIVSVSAGILFAGFLPVGSVISQLAWLAVIGMFTIPVLASSVGRPSLRRLALALLVPAVAIGLSFGELDDALSLAWAIVVGGLWMAFISLCWPERPPEAPVPVPAMTAGQARTWGSCWAGRRGRRPSSASLPASRTWAGRRLQRCS
jgi:hypothetical protein